MAAKFYQSYDPTDPDDQFRNEVYSLLSDADPPAAERYFSCHRQGYGTVEYCPHDLDHYQHFKPRSCMLRICPVCSEYLAARVRDRYEPAIEKATCVKRPGWSLKLVTLTRSKQLSSSIGLDVLHTLDSAQKIYNKLWGRDDGAGGIATLEVGEHGKKIHVHMIVYGKWFWKSEVVERAQKSKIIAFPAIFAYLCGLNAAMLASIISNAYWKVNPSGEYVSETWEDLTGDYIVDIRESSVKTAVKEGLKYITKASKLTPSELVELHLALKGRRRIRSWGCFYGIPEPETEAVETACPTCGSSLEKCTELEFVHILADFMQRIEEDFEHALIDLKRANKSPPEIPQQVALW
jgi:hypothetical protein